MKIQRARDSFWCTQKSKRTGQPDELAQVEGQDGGASADALSGSGEKMVGEQGFFRRDGRVSRGGRVHAMDAAVEARARVHGRSGDDGWGEGENMTAEAVKSPPPRGLTVLWRRRRRRASDELDERRLLAFQRLHGFSMLVALRLLLTS